MSTSRCPTCKKEVSERIKNVWPFCSARCKELDLGAWAKGDYRIAGQSVDPETISTQFGNDSEYDED